MYFPARELMQFINHPILTLSHGPKPGPLHSGDICTHLPWSFSGWSWTLRDLSLYPLQNSLSSDVGEDFWRTHTVPWKHFFLPFLSLRCLGRSFLFFLALGRGGWTLLLWGCSSIHDSGGRLRHAYLSRLSPFTYKLPISMNPEWEMRARRAQPAPSCA